MGDGGYFRIKWGQCWIGDGACTAIGTLPTYSLANLAESQPTGWSKAVVARNSSGATSTSCSYTVLDGLLNNTYINYAGINNGDIPASAFGCKTYIDDVEVGSANFAEMDPNQRFCKNNEGPFSVYGGRHTVRVSLDSDDTVFESDESAVDNNICGQFVWSPIALGKGTSIPRTAPPIKATCAGTGLYNCDGFSFSAGNSGGNGYWSAIAALPSSSGIYGVRIYDRGSYYGVLNGFDQYFIGQSIETTENCHYGLVNSRKTPAGTYYASVVNWDEKDSDYQLQHATSSTIQAGQNAGWNDVYSLSGNSVIKLHEVYLTPGS